MRNIPVDPRIKPVTPAKLRNAQIREVVRQFIDGKFAYFAFGKPTTKGYALNVARNLWL